MEGNRLVQAIISAPFQPAQRQIVLTLLQLSVEQKRQSVNVSLAQLATLCGYEKVSGGFREQLKQLVTDGVVVVETEGGGASSNRYGLELNFERWGKYSRSTADLARTWGASPDHAEQLPLPIMTVERAKDPASVQAGSPVDPASVQAPCLSTDRVTLPAHRHPASTQAGSTLPLHRQGASPEAGSNGVSAEKSTIEAGAEDSSDPRGGVGGGVVRSKGRRRTTPPLPPRGEAIELLSAIYGMVAEQPTPNGVARWIPIARVKEKLGDDVAQALEMLGAKRVLDTPPANRGILEARLTDALARVRARTHPSAEAVG